MPTITKAIILPSILQASRYPAGHILRHSGLVEKRHTEDNTWEIRNSIIQSYNVFTAHQFLDFFAWDERAPKAM